MLVYLQQYSDDEAKETIRSEGEVEPDRDPDEHLDVDSLDSETWERTELDGRTVLRRAVTYDDVTALSVPEDYPHEGDLPGATIQLRTDGGETEYVEQAVVVEVQDATPE